LANTTLKAKYPSQLLNQHKSDLKDEIDAEIDRKMRANRIEDFTIITIANYGFREFVLNWIMSLSKCGYHKFVVFSFDQALVDHLAKKGYQNNAILVPRVWLDYNISSNYADWAQDTYVQIVKSKTNVWQNLLARNYSFLFSDPDVAWISSHILDHIKFQFEHSLAEVLFSQDQEPRIIYCNTGFFYATATSFVKTLFTDLLNLQRAGNDTNYVEQFYLRDMLVRRRFNDKRVDTLDIALYANGNSYFDDRINKKLNSIPLTLHMNYIVGQDAKMKALKLKGYWYL
jgi:hypothetical protein